MGWRETLGVDAPEHFGDIGKTTTIHTKPPVPDEKDPQAPSSVCIVPDSLIPPKDTGGIPSTVKAGSNDRQFSIGQTVAYRIPIIKSHSDYFWEWHTGTIQAIDFHNERLTLTPEDEAEPWRVIAWIYACRKDGSDENRPL